MNAAVVSPTDWSRNWLVFNVLGKSGTNDI